jgi:hypothetical protein
MYYNVCTYVRTCSIIFTRKMNNSRKIRRENRDVELKSVDKTGESNRNFPRLALVIIFNIVRANFENSHNEEFQTPRLTGESYNKSSRLIRTAFHLPARLTLERNL